MNKAIAQQYEMVKSSRAVLFDYCQKIPSHSFCENIKSFGDKSMHYLILHNANCYRFWIGATALKKPMKYLTYEREHSWEEIHSIYEAVDAMMENFLLKDLTEEIPFDIRGIQGSTSGLQMVTHTMTHEFHHKGQIVAMGRSLGYTPVDTDILR